MTKRAEQKRELRVQIGRLRRRIDRRARAVNDDSRQALSWRTYATRWPGNLVLGALGLGMALSAGLGARRMVPWLGRRLLTRAIRNARRHLLAELARLWNEAAPGAKRSVPCDEQASTAEGGSRG